MSKNVEHKTANYIKLQRQYRLTTLHLAASTLVWGTTCLATIIQQKMEHNTKYQNVWVPNSEQL